MSSTSRQSFKFQFDKKLIFKVLTCISIAGTLFSLHLVNRNIFNFKSNFVCAENIDISSSTKYQYICRWFALYKNSQSTGRSSESDLNNLNGNFLKSMESNSTILTNENWSTVTSSTQRYVTLCAGCFNSRRSGNQLFNLIGLLYVQKYTGRLPILARKVPYGWLDKIFDHRILLVDKVKPNYCPCLIVNEQDNYEPLFDNFSNPYYDEFKTIELCGYMQTFRYVDEVREQLQLHLNFRGNIVDETRNFLLSHADKILKNYSRLSMSDMVPLKYIGVHNRRTDFTTNRNGFISATSAYIKNAIEYYLNIRRLENGNSANPPSNYHIVFVVCSDDIAWTKAAILASGLASSSGVSFLYSEGHSVSFDWKLLMSCNDSIITAGTFSWWAGYLAGGRVVYYKHYPIEGSALDRYINRNDYYPKDWVGLE